ncbi:porin [Ursidibacter sp. B-7004-1]
MKKTLVALAVAAFATSASAITVYENEGSKVDFDGSIRLRLDNEKSKTDNQTTKRAHTNLHNDGSRFGVRTKHDLGNDFFAFSRVEFRFNSEAKTTDGFGDLYAHRAYVGVGSKQFGEVSFGRQVTIGDDIAQAGFDEAYGVFDTTLTTSGKSVVRYDYKGIEGLQVGVDYRFAEERDANGEVALPGTDGKDKLKSGYGAGVTYGFKVAEGQSAKVAAGYTRDNYKVTGSQKHHKDAWAVGASYSINDLTLAADYAGAFDKEGADKDRFNGFRVGAKYQVTPAVAVYGNYGYGVSKDKTNNVTVSKDVFHKFMLGSSYQVHKNVFTYVEGSVGKVRTTDYTDNTKSKKSDNNIGVGLRVFW